MLCCIQCIASLCIHCSMYGIYYFYLGTSGPSSVHNLQNTRYSEICDLCTIVTICTQAYCFIIIYIWTYIYIDYIIIYNTLFYSFSNARTAGFNLDNIKFFVLTTLEVCATAHVYQNNKIYI